MPDDERHVTNPSGMCWLLLLSYCIVRRKWLIIYIFRSVETWIRSWTSGTTPPPPSGQYEFWAEVLLRLVPQKLLFGLLRVGRWWWPCEYNNGASSSGGLNVVDWPTNHWPMDKWTVVRLISQPLRLPILIISLYIFVVYDYGRRYAITCTPLLRRFVCRMYELRTYQ